MRVHRERVARPTARASALSLVVVLASSYRAQPAMLAALRSARACARPLARQRESTASRLRPSQSTTSIDLASLAHEPRRASAAACAQGCQGPRACRRTRRAGEGGASSCPSSRDPMGQLDHDGLCRHEHRAERLYRVQQRHGRERALPGQDADLALLLPLLPLSPQSMPRRRGRPTPTSSCPPWSVPFLALYRPLGEPPLTLSPSACTQSPTMTEGGISEWKVKEGDAFEAGAVLLTIETDKASIDVEAQDDGIMGKILVRRLRPSTLVLPPSSR